MIRVVLPAHLRALARITGEVQLEVDPPVTQRALLDALEARYPVLGGKMRDHVTQQRRPFVRFYACEEDLSHESPEDAVARCRGERDRTVSRHRCDGRRVAVVPSVLTGIFTACSPG